MERLLGSFDRLPAQLVPRRLTADDGRPALARSRLTSNCCGSALSPTIAAPAPSSFSPARTGTRHRPENSSESPKPPRDPQRQILVDTAPLVEIRRAKNVSGDGVPGSVPSAIWLIFRRAEVSLRQHRRQRQASALLSNPYAALSAGSSEAASISSASMSRMALRYSARFRRCRVGRPGLGCCERRPVEARLRARRRRLDGSALSGRGRPPAASRPCESCARPSPTRRRRSLTLRQVQHVERESARLQCAGCGR